MTVLHREALDERLDSNDPIRRIVVTPMLDRTKQVGPASIDLRLGTDFLLPRRSTSGAIDASSESSASTMEHATSTDELQERVVLPLGRWLWLQPKQFVLGSTLEFVRLPDDCAAYVLSRSSWGRVGLLVATAVTVQPGFSGSLTLELVNEADTPIRLRPGLRVAQLVVHQMDDVTAFPYRQKYVRAIGPEPAKLGWDDADVQEVDRVGKQFASGEFAARSTSGDVEQG